jgi:hypothetical protein
VFLRKRLVANRHKIKAANPAGHVSREANMLKNSGLTQDQWAAVMAAALATAYLVYTLVGLGTDFQATRQSRLAEQVSVRHSAICTYLGKLPASADHSACMDTLLDLKGWHERVFQEENESLL